MARPKKVQPEPNKKEFRLNPAAYELIHQFNKMENPPNRFGKFEIPYAANISDGEKLTGDKLTTDTIPLNGVDYSTYSKINKTLLNSWFLGYQEYSILSQNGIIQNIIQSYSQDCVREWIEIKSVSRNAGNKEDKIRKINAAFEEFKVREKFKNAMELSVMMGGCKIYPKIRGDDSSDGGVNEYTMPFYKEKMKKGDLLYLKVIEPLYVTPVEFNAVNPLAEDFYIPKTWTVLTTIMHASRLCHFSYNYVPTLLKPVYWFNGMPLVQLCLDYIMGFESVRQNIVGISGRYNINIFKTNMEALLNYSDGVTFQSGQDSLSRLKLAQALMSNFSIFALSNDKESEEEWQQFNMTIAGLDNLLSLNAELVCAVCRIPAIKLFGTSPKGFNSTGENELRTYYDLIRSMQMSVLHQPLQQVFELIQIHLFGEVDSDLEIHFRPLWTPSALEQAQIQAIKKDINIAYAAETIITPEEIRKQLNEDPHSGFSGLVEDFEGSDEDELTDEESTEERKKVYS